MSTLKVGLLPQYLKLYDDTLPVMRPAMESFLQRIAAGLTAAGLDVVRVPICRVAAEFAAAVATIERAGAEAIISLHLAYSPSLESIEALTATDLPLVLLDTTPDFAFGPDVAPERILYNHGIHGVQDLACMFRRRGRNFEIVAGHAEHSDVLARAAGLARAALAARRLRRTNVLRIGESFRGMGDFAVGDGQLREALGMAVREVTVEELAAASQGVTDAMVDRELAQDAALYDVQAGADVHRRSVRVGLVLRRYLEQGAFSAFSFNFLSFNSADDPLDTVPFLEAGKAMVRGIGYAGEGDVLTAGLVGALLSAWPRTTFTEIFCPDWREGTLFLSHMGEINPAVAAGKAALCEKDFPWTPARKPAAFACAPAEGPAVLVNLAPAEEGSFRLIVAPVDVFGDATSPQLRQGVRGWIRPELPLAYFLEEYSRWGGTHHSALVLGRLAPAIAAMGRFAGIPLVCLGGSGETT